MNRRLLTTIFVFLCAALSMGGSPFAAAESLSVRHAILSEIERQPGFGPYEIEVYARGGLVILEGKVASERSRALAEEIARSHSTVAQVNNNLIVDADKARAFEANSHGRAAETAQLIRERVLSRKDLADYDLNVRVRGDTAILEGSVKGSESRRAIEDIALNTPGVRSVTNQLVVSEETAAEGGKDADVELARRVLDAYRANPEIDTSGLTVIARDGVVTVRGLRPNHRDRDRILSVTLNVPGVRDIRSELR